MKVTLLIAIFVTVKTIHGFRISLPSELSENLKKLSKPTPIIKAIAQTIPTMSDQISKQNSLSEINEVQFMELKPTKNPK